MIKKILTLIAMCNFFYIFPQEKLIIADAWFGNYYFVSNNTVYHYDESFDMREILHGYEEDVDNDGYRYVILNGTKKLYIKNYPFKEIDFLNISFKENTQLPFNLLNIKKITASSFLVENSNTYYKPENLLQRYLMDAEDGYIWNDDQKPWSEGIDSYGHGEWIEIEFIQPVQIIRILNGYVDFNHKSLFRDNNRIKDAKIYYYYEDEVYEVANLVFDDVVEYKQIQLPQKTTRIKIEIASVYSGRKWNDTCISAVLGFEENTTYESEIIRIKTLFDIE